MKKHAIILSCAVLVIGIAAATNMLRAQPPGGAAEGFLETGVRYVFIEDFNFNEFREQIDIISERTMNSTIIAETPAQAAESGQHFLSSFSNMEPDRARQWTVYVKYCSETDIWLLEHRNAALIPAMPFFLLISRLDGGMSMIFHRG